MPQVDPRIRFLKRIALQQNWDWGQAAILHYDSVSRDLRTWFWPASVQENRVTPDAILDYRISHKLRCPSCLCAASDIDTAYTESAIYKSTHGTYSGEYLVACAAGRCGYLISLDRMFGKRGLILGQYPVRDAGEQAPPPVLRLPGLIDMPISLDAELTGIDNVIASIPARRNKVQHNRSVLKQLLALDSRTGLSQSQFKKIVGQCTCTMLVAYGAFRYHTCPVYRIEPVVIDLTLDTDSDDDSAIDLTSDTNDDSVIDLTSDTDTDTDDDSFF